MHACTQQNVLQRETDTALNTKRVDVFITPTNMRIAFIVGLLTYKKIN